MVRTGAARVAVGVAGMVLLLGAAVVSPVASASTVPGPVGAAWVSDRGVRSLTVSWSPPEGGVTPEDYSVEVATQEDGPWTRVNDGVSTSTSSTLTGLITGTGYFVRVAAVADGAVGEPVRVSSGDLTATSIAFGFGICAVMVGGRVLCDEEGSGTVVMQGMSSATLIKAAEGRHLCAVVAEGRVRCKFGGSGSETYTVPGVTGAIDLAVVNDWGCAIIAGGVVRCWNTPFKGAVVSSFKLTDGPATSLMGSSEFSEGDFCWLGISGVVTCSRLNGTQLWSRDFDGAVALAWAGGPLCAQREDGTVACLPSARSEVPPTSIPGINSVSSISAAQYGFPGEAAVCVTTTRGAVSCWGDDFVPATISGFTDVRAIAALRSGTLCALSVDGDMSCGGTSDLPGTIGRDHLVWGADYSAAQSTPAPSMVARLTQSLDAGQLTTSSAVVSWTPADADAKAPVTGYRVRTSDSADGPWTLLATLAPSTRTREIAGLRAASRTWVEVTALSAAGDGTTRVIPVFTKGLRTSRVKIQTASGEAVAGGSITWVSAARAGTTYKSVKAVGLTVAGLTEFTSAPAGPVRVSLDDGILPNGMTVSGTWQTYLGGEDAEVLALPESPAQESRAIQVRMPGDIAVVGAKVEVSGLRDSATTEGFTFHDPRTQSPGVTDAAGNFSIVGFPFGLPLKATVTYSNDVLRQVRANVPLDDPVTIIELEPMPWLDVAIEDVSASAGDLVPVVVTALSASRTQARARQPLKNITVTIVPPPGASQDCPGAKLKDSTDSQGKVALKVCATKSGVFTIVGKGAVATSAVTLRVTGAAPMPVTVLSADSPKSGQLRVSWNPPVFSGGRGFPVTAYTIVVASGRDRTVVAIDKDADLRRRSVTVKGLTSAKTYTVTVTASNKAGASDVVTVTGTPA